jgi:thermitase
LSPRSHIPFRARPLASLPVATTIAIVASLLVTTAAGRARASGASPPAIAAHDDTRLIVKLRAASSEGDAPPGGARARSPEFERLMRGYGIDRADPLLPPQAVRRQRPDQARRRGPLEQYLILRAPRAFDVAEAALAFRRLSEVETAEPDFIASPAGTARASAALPDDPDFAVYQWGFRNTGDQITQPASLPRVAGADIHAADAWAVTTGDPRVIVAVLDTGVRTDHPEFAGRIWKNEGEIPENLIDDDQNGYVDDVGGYNFVSLNPNPYDDVGHGTAVASILAANANNGAQIAGLDWACRLMVVKVLGASTGTFSGIAQGIAYAADNGAKVINMSLGGYGESQLLEDACAYAHDAGVLIAAAMRNENTSSPAYPAAYDNWVTAVGGTDPADDRCTPEVSGYGSNYGPHIDVVAPGVSIAVLDSGEPTGVALAAGTSFSTPMVAGLASLLFAVRPDLTADQARDLIRYSAADLVGRPAEDLPGFDIYHGWGRIDCAGALALAATTGFPTIAVPDSIRGVEGAPIEFEVVASDPDGDAIESLEADLTALPAGPSFTASSDHTRGLFAWTPGYSQAGQFWVRFSAKNPFEAAATTSIEVLDVPDPPVVTVPLVPAGEEGTPFEAVITAADPDGDPLQSFTGSPLPAGATFTPDPDLARGVFAWTPGHAQAGTYTITFSVESLDPSGPLGEPLVEHGYAVLRFLIREGPDQAPVLVAPDHVDAAEGSPVTVEVFATDADGAADPITSLTATPLPTGATFAVAEGNGSGTLAWTPGYQQAGSYEIRLAAESAHRAALVSDPVVTEVSMILTLVVADTPRPPTALPGGPYEGVVGVPIAFDGSGSSDPDGTPLASFRWEFGDGASGAGASPSHAYGTGGVFAVSLTVSDGVLEATAATSAAVRDVIAARAFPDPQDRAIRLLSAKPSVCLRVEPVDGSFGNDAVDLGSASLHSTDTGDVDRISAVEGKGTVIGDADRNGIPDFPVCFAKEDLRRLFSKLPAGKQSVPVAIEAALTTGGTLRAELELEVVAPGEELAATVTPNPIRAGGVISLRLNAGGPVRLRLFDAAGRLVRVMESDRGGTGGYRDVPFDGRDDAGRTLGSGIYFYRVESGSGRASGRLAVIR